MAEAAFRCLVFSSCVMVFNLPVGRSLLVLSILLYAIDCYKTKCRPFVSPVFWLALVFIVSAFISTMQGLDPADGFRNLRKLIWYPAGIFAYAALVRSQRRLGEVLVSFAVGASVLAVWELVLVGVTTAGALGDGVPVIEAIKNAASMSDAQRLMAGILVTLAVVMQSRNFDKRSLVWVGMIVLQALALLLTFKRGSWISLVVVLAAVIGMKSNWRYVAGLIGAVVLIALLPPVRGRLADIGGELKLDSGGRTTMWFTIAPAINKQHPWLGIGWRATTSEMMVEIAPNVERNRNHLHSNIAEIIVETGWIGFAVYMLWMGYAVFQAVRFHVSSGSAEEMLSSLAVLGVLCALLLNGLVEFNFSDGEIVIIYSMVMGCGAAGLQRLDFSPNPLRVQFQ